jgi:hypothetical protein
MIWIRFDSEHVLVVQAVVGGGGGRGLGSCAHKDQNEVHNHLYFQFDCLHSLYVLALFHTLLFHYISRRSCRSCTNYLNVFYTYGVWISVNQYQHPRTELHPSAMIVFTAEK